MTPYYFILLCLCLIIPCVSALVVNLYNNSEVSVLHGSNPYAVGLEPFFKGRSLKSLDQLDLDPNQDTFFLTDLDGKVYSVDSNSGDVRWSLPSGPPIYSSYQALPSDGSDYNYVDINNDWKLVLKAQNNTVLKIYPATMDEYNNGLPKISEHGEVTIGTKKTTVFALDAESGRVISKYTLDSSPNVKVEGDGDYGNLVKAIAMDWKPIKLIYLIRADYFIQSFYPSGKVKWNLALAEISISFPFQGHGGNELGVYGGDPMVPLSYQGRVIVPRIRVVAIPNPKHGDEMVPRQDELALPGPNSNLDIAYEDKSPNYINWWKVALRLTKMLGSVGLAIFLLHKLSRMSFLAVARQVKFTEQFNDSKEKQTPVSKRKKARRLGNNKSNANFGKNNKITFFEDGKKTNGRSGIERNEPLLDLTKPVNGGSVGRKVGKLFVSNIEISKGSNGTVVLEGNYEGRPVAIKRVVKAHNDAAFKEIQNLIASDRHPNIVRWYGVEYDSDFVYLSLERCTCNLNDLIQICSTSSQSSVIVEDMGANSVNEYHVQLDSMHGINKDIELWKANGYPSPQLLKMMRDVVSGLAHLHELGIIHRDLKPQNVLILKERSLCVKLSDMGISKRLTGDMSSLGYHATGSGSSGWQAPEQLLNGRQTRSVDLFSLGCVLFFCLTGGKHPFGDRLERDINIVKNRIDLFMIDHIPEAVNLLSQLLNSDPESRPKALNVLHHPLFWNSEMRLSFLRDTSDRVELEDRENESDLLKALEEVAPVALGGKWDEKMEATFIANIGRYRRYKFDSTRDLLRVIRNKLNHYRELPKDIQEILGPVPEGFNGYFASRFPRFLIEVYKVIYKYCREEDLFSKYFKSNLI